MEKHVEKLIDHGHLTLFGEIDEEKVEDLMEKMLYLTKVKSAGRRRRRPSQITLWINSAGGLLQPAFALVDLFDILGRPVSTVGLGSVESAAALVLMAGTKGRRFVTRHCSVMLHEYTWSNSGSFTEIQGRLKEVHQTLDKQLAVMSRFTGKSRSDLRKILKHEETWLTPQEAIEWGIVDKLY
jgi:ATP-dependent Clp protease protease subunit